MADLKPIVLDEPTNQKLWSLYKATFPRREDAARNFETYRWIVMSDRSQMFEGPHGTFLYVTDVSVGHPIATFHLLNDAKWEIPARNDIVAAISEMMDILGLTRLCTYVPEPVTSTLEMLDYLGFTHEGTLRSHIKFNDEFVGMVCLGLLRDELVAWPELEEVVEEPDAEVKRSAKQLIERTFNNAVE